MIRNTSDKMFPLLPGDVKLFGMIDTKIAIIAKGVLKQIDMHALADFFRNTMDQFAAGEFWGKILRASCLVYSYTKDPELKRILDTAVDDMLSIQQPNGCLSTVPKELQPNGTYGSDMWERKYALMGLLEYYDLTKREDVLKACEKLIIYTNTQIGDAPEKTPITKTGWEFFGIESSSILETLMRVYSYSKLPEALELAKHIIRFGCCERENIFQAIRSGKSPYQIGSNGNPKESIAKAYEMMSCVEGLLGYYQQSGDREAFETAQIFWDKIFEEEITLLGSGGADAPFNLGAGPGEQWNKTKQEQTNPDIHLMMETCVTVYWIRFCFRMLCLTGKVKYADALEVSIYNAILGALKPDGLFFEYFPKFNGNRNSKVNYSFCINGFDLSCCTANGPTGLAMAPYIAFMQTKNGCAINFYENAAFSVHTNNGCIDFEMTSDFPKKGMAKLKIVAISGSCGDDFDISLRVPSYAENFFATCNGKTFSGISGEYLVVTTKLQVGLEMLISFDIPLVRHDAPHGSNRLGNNFEAFTYGSILLARDSRTNENPLEPLERADIFDYRIESSNFGGFFQITAQIGTKTIVFCDYQSAGNSWNAENTFASWLPTI